MIDDDAGGHTTGVQTAARVIEASKAYFVIGSFVLYFVIRLLLWALPLCRPSGVCLRLSVPAAPRPSPMRMPSDVAVFLYPQTNKLWGPLRRRTPREYRCHTST